MINFVLDVGVNLIASVFFLVVLFGMRPNIKISYLIAKSKSYDGKDEYLIKIINKGLFPVINIRAELYYINKALVSGGEIDEHRRIKLKTNSIMVLGKVDKKKPSDEYLFHFSTRENITKELRKDPELKLRIKIIADHSITNFSKVFVMTYNGLKSIRNNEFKYGDSIIIEELL